MYGVDQTQFAKMLTLIAMQKNTLIERDLYITLDEENQG